MDNISVNVLSQFVTYIGMILFFIPTYIILHFLFKKIKKKNIRYLLFSISIPLTLFIYILMNWLPFVPIFFKQSLNNIFLITGIYWINVVLPISFITTLCTPKKYLEEKYYNLACIFLTEIFGLIFFFLTLFIALSF